jgi:hypothetical protein
MAVEEKRKKEKREKRRIPLAPMGAESQNPL